MSAPLDPVRATTLLRPATFLVGFAVGIALLSWGGRSVGRFDWHGDFTRFHPMIAPESMYEPTISEMEAIVRARCRPDQVLVIVGGNSIFLGVGQPADKIWTRRLQEDLGDHYVVVNLAFRGAVPNDAGAVVAEALRNEFPRLIYVANSIPFQSGNAVGLDTYRFALLDAYYKGLLLPWPPRDKALSGILHSFRYQDFPAMDKQIGAILDSWLYFHNFWNWWSFTRRFTFATNLMPHDPQSHAPRMSFKDEETDFDSIPFETRFRPQVAAADLKIALQYTASVCRQNPDKSWTLDSDQQFLFGRSAREEFPDAVKPRTLIAVSRNSPFYTSQLPPDIRARDELAIRATIAELKSLGYDSMDYGADFLPEDFGDRTHLTSSGGTKLADLMAPEIGALAGRLGYVQP